MTSIRRSMVATVLVASVSLGIAGAARAGEAASLTAPRFGAWGLDLSSRDLSVPPGTDFYRYANGNWLKRAEIPADKSAVNHFVTLGDLAEAITAKLIEDAAAGTVQDIDATKVGAAFRSFMDEARIEQLDAKPLAPDIAAIRAETTKTDVAALMGTATTSEQERIFRVGIGPDFKVADHYALYLGLRSLGLPDRDYYLNDQFAAKKAAYITYVARMLDMVGWPSGEAKAVVALETELAQASWSRAEQRDLQKMYHPMTPAELAHYAPGFDFAAFLKSAGVGDVARIVLRSDTALPKTAKIFDTTPLDTLKAWQVFHLVNGVAYMLSKRFVDASFAFYGKELAGRSENTPRWKRGVAFTNSILIDAIGRMYVAKTFPPDAKAKVDVLVKDLRTAMQKRIEAAHWMTPATKAKALEKLAKMALKIGYPAKWRDYGGLVVKPDDAFGNARRAIAFSWAYKLARLNKPIDRTEWLDQYPQVVNAGYNPTNNDLTFPAAILQPPFFDPKADAAVNFGGIGMVIGHEITHAFDDQGRTFGPTGVLDNWWSAEDAAKFKSQADRLAAQYDKFEPVKGYFVNGQLTMGENIADLGGVLLALDAYHASLNGKPAPVLDGLSGDQRLFLGTAQVWQEKRRNDSAIELSKVDVHAPSQFRVNGPFRNVAAWYSAFDIKPTDPMYIAPEQRVHIW